jgi:hypothetical protein
MADQEAKYVKRNGHNSGYWSLQAPPSILVEDLFYALVDQVGNRSQYLFVVVGDPFEKSPEWDKSHPMLPEVDVNGKPTGRDVSYDYAQSYAIPSRTVGTLLADNEEETIETLFNNYLDAEETLNGWKEIYEVKIVDQTRWKNG